MYNKGIFIILMRFHEGLKFCEVKYKVNIDKMKASM